MGKVDLTNEFMRKMCAYRFASFDMFAFCEMTIQDQGVNMTNILADTDTLGLHDD